MLIAVSEFLIIPFQGMQDIPPELVQWSQRLSRIQLVQFSNTINIPESELQPYIVKTDDSVTTAESAPLTVSNGAVSDEVKLTIKLLWLGVTLHLLQPMQVESDEETSESTTINLDDGTLPSISIGSEPWHEHVPVVRRNLLLVLYSNTFFAGLGPYNY